VQRSGTLLPWPRLHPTQIEKFALGARVHALSSPTPLSQLIFTHIFGWTPGVDPKVPALYLRRLAEARIYSSPPGEKVADEGGRVRGYFLNVSRPDVSTPLRRVAWGAEQFCARLRGVADRGAMLRMARCAGVAREEVRRQSRLALPP
jgi:hypothetical protein